MSVHKQHVVALCCSCLNETVLLFAVVAVEVDCVAFLVCLLGRYECLVLLVGVFFTFGILQQGIFACLVVEVLLGEHSVVDKNLKVVPFLLEFVTVVLED